MGPYPRKCPSCGESNTHNLDYCAVCGAKFKAAVQAPTTPAPEKIVIKEKRPGKDVIRKRRELLELLKQKSITPEEYASRVKKLGFSTDIEAALEFKKFIGEQIRAFEEVRGDLLNAGPRREHITSDAELLRDEDGEVITDFMAGSLDAIPKKRIRDVPRDTAPYSGEPYLERMGETRTVKVVWDQGGSSRKMPREIMWDEDEEEDWGIEEEEEDWGIEKGKKHRSKKGKRSK